ncbi:MAG TPA: hypothetical protein VIU61_12915 [Kofleriaceae bacterium]
MRSVLLLLATLCLASPGPRDVASKQELQSKLAAAAPGLPAKLAPRRFGEPSVQRDRRDAPRDASAPLFVVTEAVPPLVEPPRVALPGAPGQPWLVIAAATPSRSSRGPPG